jgi:hypothetical protein
MIILYYIILAWTWAVVGPRSVSHFWSVNAGVDAGVDSDSVKRGYTIHLARG